MHNLSEFPFTVKYIIILLVTAIIALILTPIMVVVSRKIGAVDHPNARRINVKPMPSAGGVAIFVAFSAIVLLVLPRFVSLPNYPGITDSYLSYVWPFVLGGGIVAATGLIDDIVELGAKSKLLGQIAGACIIWFFTTSHFDNFKIPFGGPLLVFPDWLSFLATIFWILAITNAVNLIDGLDGLASGVSIISLTTMGLVAYFFLGTTNVYLPITIFVLVFAIVGFFPYNFPPAIIYLGDTGALFLGFMISVLSLQGLKNATAVAVVTPMLILGVPLTDTVVAMIRRKLNGGSMVEADRMHLHHRLLSLGLTQHAAVLVIYGIAGIFSFIALILNVSSRWGGTFLLVFSLIGLEVLIELIGVLGENRTPLLNVVKFIGNSEYRQEVKKRRKM
ncbi:MAG: MraY family glycosyltransferase [Lactococcus chungangensis]|jgi:UDP-N-acetylmuramyl pentapeptide phosphotransferase/UDP-N-acetylglucosamine-1-phosphate transferase|uniref:UDP-GlcNAc:undecaprenyl-phosphate GlcNAc-1-phosphate transferase n=1 Tax=Pseudolactococcus chungangensis CAU 28 = DSM 22330 TaxID=1122154 RepID=A0A1K2HDG1_9LACT|nr:MraY family glycosyltransferase [Lactococcus chungangensis]MDD3016084.1 MraY family glycosyltransferase [Lactococcus chungangensis]PCS02717.1 UDP-phosphate N-acetyl-glucosaminyl transferase [Lactococcus chungangensis CAU 28 = DSM 22330]SFZ74814.1 UDP-GlcNAc:undecaprenyl-phosphate GlcNAc-1-phosphate transferase [Lactococcus chungangensis CAU 28 = DSM 22330]